VRLFLRFYPPQVWAKRRALYSNVWGYFGGITWALLTAHVCQLYPALRSPTQMIQRFFFLYARWRFDFSTPVMLTAPYATLMGLEVGGTCAARACKLAGPFPPFTPQDVLSAARAAWDT
jgi:hypothetical protein